MSILKFQDRLDDIVSGLFPEYRNWEGDLIDLSDGHKDHICYHFLICMPSWWDDCFPPCVVNREDFLHELYLNSGSQSISAIIRDDIYLALEHTLRDLVQESFKRVHNIQPEPFAGYERGE